jgi:hypothetical protein
VSDSNSNGNGDGDGGGGGRIAAAWTALRADWEQEAAHRRFLDFCGAAGQLDAAARLYREALAAAPGDAAARAGVDRLVARAVAALSVPAEARHRAWVDGARRSWFWLLVVLAVATIVAFAVYFVAYTPPVSPAAPAPVTSASSARPAR